MLAEVFTQKVNVYCGFYFQDLNKKNDTLSKVSTRPRTIGDCGMHGSNESGGGSRMIILLYTHMNTVLHMSKKPR